MSIMGIQTNILSCTSNDEVDKAVIENIKRGNMSSLSVEEYFAEKLIDVILGRIWLELPGVVGKQMRLLGVKTCSGE